MTANGALRAWASLVYHRWDTSDADRQDLLTYAAAVELLMVRLSWRERLAVRGKFLCELVLWKQEALVSATRKIDQGLGKRKLTNMSVCDKMLCNVDKEVTNGA